MITIKTHYPGGKYALEIKDGKWIINATTSDDSKISNSDMIKSMQLVLNIISSQRNRIIRNVSIDFRRCFVCMESFRDIQRGIVQQLIEDEDSSYEFNKVGAFGFLAGKTKPIRIKFQTMSNNFSDLEYIETPKFVSSERPPLTWVEYKRKYRYFIDLPGHTYTTKLYTMLFCKRLIFVVFGNTKNYLFQWQKQLQPWIHYIPVKDDLSDLMRNLQWARDNPSECETIVSAAFEFGKKIGPEYMLENLAKQITKHLSQNA